MRGAKVVKGKTIVNDQDLIEFWIAFGKGIQERGGAQVGDKTMVDTLAPFVIELETQFNQSRDFVSAFTSAVNEAKKVWSQQKIYYRKKGDPAA